MKERLIQILADTLGIPATQIPADASMETIAAWDSVAHLNIMLSLEQEFHVEFGADEFIALNSLAGIEQALARRGIA